MIGVYYALTVVLIAFANDSNIRSEVDGRTVVKNMVGSTLFGVGIVGNFYHHYLLAKLRSSKKTTKYVAPSGGLFEFVATPHYLFELIGWLGVAIVSHQLNVYLVVTSMMSYLGGRSVAQNEFNRKTFSEKDWPLDRKNILPFMF
jgi:steroid 5-alpha reductase family enzyme